jgi:hypothetical protein
MLAGRPYVLRADLEEFLERVARGECARIPQIESTAGGNR